MNKINEYVMGSREYADILKIIRQHLCNPSSDDCFFGAIVFFKFAEDKSWAKVFPIDEKIIVKHFPNDKKYNRKSIEINK
ncbi:MAG: hypothetical protein IPM91_02380 [Bacteroidetes bacterium]|nr:hypothetical protein [Bacteroidota bacterium]